MGFEVVPASALAGPVEAFRESIRGRRRVGLEYLTNPFRVCSGYFLHSWPFMRVSRRFLAVRLSFAFPSESPDFQGFRVVPEVGLEPTRPCGQRILNPWWHVENQRPHGFVPCVFRLFRLPAVYGCI